MTRDEFIETWNSCNLLSEVAKKTGRTKGGCRTTATELRQRGYSLKYMPPERKRIPLFQRFWKFVQKTEGCWLWIGAVNDKGYGQIQQGRGLGAVLAHRVSYLIHFGEFDESLEVCHSCDNPPCVNPSHLFLGTHQDNMDDMVRKNRGVFGHCSIPDELAEQVKEMRQRGMSYERIGKELGVCGATAWASINGGRKRWRLLKT